MPTIKRELPPDDPRHGTMNAYNNYACRCDNCKKTASVFWVERYKKEKRSGKKKYAVNENRFTIRGTRTQKGEPNKEPRKRKESKYRSDNEFDFSVLTGPQTDPVATCLECGMPRPELALVYQDEFCSSKCCRVYHNLMPITASTSTSGVRQSYIDWNSHRRMGPRQLPNIAGATGATGYTESAASKVA